jgi:hypothetical protein
MTCATWPKRLKTTPALDYLEREHGVVLAAKTMRNMRCEGRGPRWEYLGNTPYVTPAELDRWVEATLTERPANGRKRLAADEMQEQPAAA